MNGHVYVVAGDLREIRCDAWLLPTDRGFDISASFRSAVGLEKPDRLSGRSWNGLRVQPFGERPDGAPWIWLANIGKTFESAAEYAAVIDPFVTGVRAGLSPLPDRPLVLAVNMLGTGEGGAASFKGEVLGAMMTGLHDAAAKHGVDLVLVAWRRVAYAAAQRARRRHLGERPLSSLFDLGTRQEHLEQEAERLSQRAQAQELVLFLGAGVSAGAQLPGWQDLLDELAKQIGLSPIEEAELKDLDVRDQAKLLQRRFGGTKELEAAIENRLRSPHHALSHALLASLPTTEAVTTNYDLLFESAVAATGDAMAVLPHEPHVSQGRWLLKLHGSVGQDGSIVLTRHDYLGLASQHGALFGLVQAMLMTRHMLFVGYSLGDEDFHQLVHEVRQARTKAATTDPFGTVLTLQDRALFSELWSGDLHVVAMASSDSSDEQAARTLQIFLDLVGFASSDLLGSLLDPAYDYLLDDAEVRLQEAMLDLQDAAGGLQTGAAKRVKALLRAFGGGSDAARKADGRPPEGFLPLVGHRRVEEGLTVRSLSGTYEGRTTGSCQPCKSTGCPGWFIGVRWETGQLRFICSEGWEWDPSSRCIQVTGGGEISARYVAPAPLGTPPLPKEQWKDRSGLLTTAGWRVDGGAE